MKIMEIFSWKTVVTTYKHSQVPVLVKWRLLWFKLEESAEILKPIMRDGEWIYSGDCHIVVVTAAGGRRVFLKRR